MQVYIESFYPLIVLITLAASVLLNLGLAMGVLWNLFRRLREKDDDVRILQQRVWDLEVGFKAINATAMTAPTVFQDKRKDSSTGFHSFLEQTDQTEPAKQEAEDRLQVTKQAESTTSVTTGLSRLSIFQEEFVDAYNVAAEIRERRDHFWSQYAITQIENMNAVQNRISEAAPDFKRSEAGSLMAVREPGDAFLVVPGFDQVIKQLNYESTYKFLFTFAAFDPNRVYQRFEVVSPAVLKEDGTEWKVQTLGEISLAIQ